MANRLIPTYQRNQIAWSASKFCWMQRCALQQGQEYRTRSKSLSSNNEQEPSASTSCAHTPSLIAQNQSTITTQYRKFTIPSLTVHPHIKWRHERRLGRTRKRHSVGFNRREVSPSGLQKYGTCYQPALGAFPSQLSKSSLKLLLLPLLINKKLVTVSRTVCF